MNKPGHKNDFEALYNLSDAGPYYRGLAPSDYRMPDVVAGLLRARGAAFLEARRHDGPLRLVDFGCGFGAIGTVLHYDIRTADLFERHFEIANVREGRAHWNRDREFLNARSRELSIEMEIAGLDIADEALRYARHIGAIDRAFPENLVTDSPSDALSDYMTGVDIVMESGVLGEAFAAAIPKLLPGGGTSRPWILFSPRPDMDWSNGRRALTGLGYRIEVFARSIAYRRSLSDYETADFLALAEQFGHARDAVMRDGFMRVDMLLCRPEPDADAVPLEWLRGDWRDDVIA